MKQAVILAGGKGTRLRDRLGDLPKPMIPIVGKPLIQHQIELCRDHGFNRILVLAGHRAQVLSQFLGTGSAWNLEIQVIVEPEPLGTAGAVLRALPSLDDRFLVLYADVMLEVDLDRLWKTHLQSGASATLFLHPNDHPLDSDLVEVDDSSWIRAFHNRPHPDDRFLQNLVNAALYTVEKSALAPFASRHGQLDFGHDLFPEMLRSGSRLYGYRSPEFVKDIGTPRRYDRVSAEWERGVARRCSLSAPQPAVFLDRDGTLNTEIGGVNSAEELTLIPGVAEAIRTLNHHGLRAIVITNQPVVAKGTCSEAELDRIHNKLETLLGRQHAFLDRIYFCPHHPDKGFPGERPELKIDCECRKPRPGLIHRAARDFNADLKQSWFIGDTTRDVETARRAGVRPILLRTGHAGLDGKYDVIPDLVCDDLTKAVEHVVRTFAGVEG